MDENFISSPGSQGIKGPWRWTQQRWLIDNVIRSVGIDWDHARTVAYAGVCGPESNADFAAIRNRVKKFADIAPAFEDTARRREAKGRAAEEAGQPITARHNYFMAAVHWAVAQWPIAENNDQNAFYNERKRDCYACYAKFADHKVEAAWVPVRDKLLPGWFHLPPNYQGGRIPAVVSLPGMDGFKEGSTALYGDRWLLRGIAVLALEGPGQYESAALGIKLDLSLWRDAGPAIMAWFRSRPEINPEQVGIIGSDFGAFFATYLAAAEPRFSTCAVNVPCLEPRFHTLFEEATPTYKRRFMYLAGIEDESRFDKFTQDLTWEGHVHDITQPYLCVAGEEDEVSPLRHTERFMDALRSPKQLVVYQNARHGIGDAASANMGPHFQGLAADWVVARFGNQPFASERWYVESSGRITRSSFKV